MNDDKYTIPAPNDVVFGYLKAGPWMAQLDGGFAEVVGCYCEWPKREPRYFMVTSVSNKYMTLCPTIIND